ncbi:MAG: XamI family restriction endonuclease [Bacteroidales bacterium]|nr:XamI family restriction endonuclease [Bacteroidales bacterium]
MALSKIHYINRNCPDKWNGDVLQSVKYYNEWFMNFAPATYIEARSNAIERVDEMLQATDSFNQLSVQSLKDMPDSLAILRMSTTPPIARDRLAGLAGVSRVFVKSMESGQLPPRMQENMLQSSIAKILEIVNRLLDREIMPWLKDRKTPTEKERLLAASIIADRLCGSLADPIIRNEQERRQLQSIKEYLLAKGYKQVDPKEIDDTVLMQAGTFAVHMNVPVRISESQEVKMPVDVAVKRRNARGVEMPILIECKSAGDFTNTNKRRKEEATKMGQLRGTYGNGVEFVQFLCGYFDSGYLGYEAAEGIDWVWEHRIDDFAKLDL